MLSKPWQERRTNYDFIVVGSGYGGAITAARLTTAALNPKPTLCILERGNEWPIGTFPDSLEGVLPAARNDLNPLGLYELLNYSDISVIKGSGLGGTSLINANVAIVPEKEIFQQAGWPKALNYDALQPYYDRARATLAATPHPRALALAKVQALEKRAQQLGYQTTPLNLAVNFSIDGPNPYGVNQKPCTDCGDCVTGCNVGAKNTLYMNYLPMARNAGAEIYVQTRVEWIEKLPGGGWRVHGQHQQGLGSDPFTIDASHVILAAGSLNSTEILLRSEMHGLSVSPELGRGFGGNGDFFGLAYNGTYQTDVLGYGTKHIVQLGDSHPPGPSIVGLIRYDPNLPLQQRISVEDFSFPSAYILGAKMAFAALHGEDTDVGDEAAKRQRIFADFNPLRPYFPDGALNHTMLYLVMGQDDARGTMVLETSGIEPEGRLRIDWDDVGQQIVFTRMNEELRRHARALGASFISNPTWNIFRTRHLITAHPLGGCPIGEDYLHGAVDEFGRVFSGDGSVHDGLFVSDGALVRSALGVNPFLTISALAERIAERKIRQLQGDPYPEPDKAVSFSVIDPMEVINLHDAELDLLFQRCSSMSIDDLINTGQRRIDIANRRICNDAYWKGFLPKGFILGDLEASLFTGYNKKFWREGEKVLAVTLFVDNRVPLNHMLEEIVLQQRSNDLDPGRYILVKYTDSAFDLFYDIVKIVNEGLILFRTYTGEYPNGHRSFDGVGVRSYSFDQMTVEDHRDLFQNGTLPQKQDLQGIWQLDVIANSNPARHIGWIQFDLKPDGRLESRYQLLGLLEGFFIPQPIKRHFQLPDFTTFDDEIRKVDEKLLVGKFMTHLPSEILAVLGSQSIGLFQPEPGSNQLGFYYILTPVDQKALPTNALLQPFLDAQLPDGLGMTFDEQMVGWFFEGVSTSAEGRTGDIGMANLIPASGDPQGGAACSFQVRMTIRDLNEFVDGAEHEAGMQGAITFGRLQGDDSVTCTLDSQKSLFNYLRVNPATGEAEMRYHLVFQTKSNRNFVFEGRKYMQKDESNGIRAIQEVLQDYTTLFCHVYERGADASLKEVGIAYLKFRTFENLAAIGSLTEFLRSFKVTGSNDPLLQLAGQMRFLAFTGQFVQREYDPLGW